MNRHRVSEAARAAGLAEQFEELLIAVWKLEDEWTLDDRLSLAGTLSSVRPRTDPS
jgi:hypothetical protein